MMGLLFRIWVLVIALVVCHCTSQVEKDLEEVIRKAIALDFAIYDRNEAYLINIINQDGYRICSGTIDRNQIKQVDCKYNKDHLRYGDNTFDITIYSKKNKAILFETTTGFHYEKPRSVWIAERMRDAVSNPMDSLAELTSTGFAGNGTTRPILVSSGVVGGLGVGYFLSKQANRRSIANWVRSVWSGGQPDHEGRPEDVVVPGGNGDEDAFPPPPPPPPSPKYEPLTQAPRPPLLGSLRGAFGKASASRAVRSAGLLLGAALLGRGAILPALERIQTTSNGNRQIQILSKPLVDLASKLQRSVGVANRSSVPGGDAIVQGMPSAGSPSSARSRLPLTAA